jgi:hypothetical protein
MFWHTGMDLSGQFFNILKFSVRERAHFILLLLFFFILQILQALQDLTGYIIIPIVYIK